MYRRFDVSRIKLKPLGERKHDTLLEDIKPLGCSSPMENADLDKLAGHIAEARRRGSAVIVLMGAHVIKVGMSRFIIDLMERGFITHIGLNGAGVIHDFELALVGGTSESVQRYISEGQFGLWQETGRINDIVKEGVTQGLGIGKRWVKPSTKKSFPTKMSVCWRRAIACVSLSPHISIGQDIIHAHPNFDGASFGAGSHTDFLVFAESVRNLEGGVMLNIGTG